MEKLFDVAVVGATGMVGQKMLEVMAERKLPIKNLYLFASSKSAGKKVTYEGKEYQIIECNEENIKSHKADIALFSAGAGTSKAFAPVFAALGTVVIDNSSYWRTDPTVPLVVPEVNAAAIRRHKNIIANPNCSTIQAVVALAPLHRAFKIKRVVYSTYQSVSGAGLAGFNDLKNGAAGVAPTKFIKPIFGNVLPHIDVFLENGYTKEEEKMIFETRKILEDESLKITATTVRVPVFYGHSESVNVEFYNPAPLAEIKRVLAEGEGIVLMDDPANNVYPTPLETENTDPVYVGRVREDDSVEYGCNLWVVADNIRKGAATNAVQIAERVMSGNY